MDDFIEDLRHIYANPSAIHSLGKEAKNKLEEARESIGKSFNVDSQYLSFTSSGTESNNIVLSSFLEKKSDKQVLVSSFEHSSILKPIRHLKKQGFQVREIPCLSNGLIDLEALDKLLETPTELISIMWVSNEMGSIQPLRQIAEKVEKHKKEKCKKIYFHCDMVQALGKVRSFDSALAHVDSASFSGHKIGTPKGIGLLYCRRNLQVLYQGGGQERGLRSGTENVPLAMYLARSIEKYFTYSEQNFNEVYHLYSYLYNKIVSLPKFRIIPLERKENTIDYVPHIISLAVKGLTGEIVARLLSQENIYVGTGSSCNQNSKQASFSYLPRLTSVEKNSIIRISLNIKTTYEEIDYFFENLCSLQEQYAL